MSSSTPKHQSSQLPAIHLLCRFASSSVAFEEAVKEYFPTLRQHTNITTHKCSLARLPDDVTYDCIVSPANSYGRMDGAFDDAITIALSPNPREGYGWTTGKVQQTLYRKWRGYAPPGTCTLIDVRKDADWHAIKDAETAKKEDAPETDHGGPHKGGCKYIALCPTMRVPREVKWDREVVFECLWAMMCAIDAHNQEIGDADLKIKTILMTPLATGVGRVSEAKWAAQCVLAMKLYLEAVEDPEKWSNLDWEGICSTFAILEKTHDL